MKKSLGPTAVGGPSGLPPAEQITALVVVGRGEVLRLSPAKMKFTLGSDLPPVTDLRVTTPGAPDTTPEVISRRHAELYRDSFRLLVHDMSRNGTFFRDRKITKDVTIEAGDTISLAGVKLLAIDEQLANLRTDLSMALGFAAHASVDDALATIAKGGHLLLAGPPGCDHRQLARKIHERSARRFHAFVELGADALSGPALAAALGEASLGTVVLDLHRPGRPLAVATVKELFNPDRHVRVIAAAPSVAQAYQRLGEGCARLTPIDIPPIKARRADLLVLFDYLCAELPTERRLAELEPAWDTGSLTAFDWPGNLDEMRHELPWLVALAEHKKVRATARALDMPHNTLGKWIKRIGLTPRGARRGE
jgi:hypothetical protein